METLTETSPELLAAVDAALEGSALAAWTMNTGGGCFVLAVGGAGAPMRGREVWLTRDGQWLIGFYDFAANEEDEGACAYLIPRREPGAEEASAEAVAHEVAAFARRYLSKEAN